MASISVDKLYKTVIAEVIDNMKEAVLDEGIDEIVLTELKLLWEQKLAATKATDAKPIPSHYPIPPVSSSGMSRSKQSGASSSTQSLAIHPPQQITMGAQQVFRPAAVRPHQTLPLDMSGAATTATMALPPMYQQQLLAGGIQLQQTSSGLTAVIPASALQSGNINLQQVQQRVQQHVQQVQQQAQIQQIQPQNLSTKVQGQLDGANDCPQPTDLVDTHTTQHTSCRPKTNRKFRRKPKEIEVIIQLDGADTSSEDDDDIDDDDDEEVENEGVDGEEEEEPLNSGDDDDEEDASATMFEMENVIVCQYDKITRSKNRWRFTLKDGIMNINQRDYVFHKAHGDAEW